MKIKWQKMLLVFVLMGIFYLALEVVVTAAFGTFIRRFSSETKYLSFIGYSSFWMFFVGGLAGILLGVMNEIKFIQKRINIFFQTLIGMTLITVIEFFAGLLLNIKLGFGIWDYTHEIIHIMGQISLLHTVIWFMLTPLVFWVDDAIKYAIYKEGTFYSPLKIYKSLFNVIQKAKTTWIEKIKG